MLEKQCQCVGSSRRRRRRRRGRGMAAAAGVVAVVVVVVVGGRYQKQFEFMSLDRFFTRDLILKLFLTRSL